MSKKSHKQHGTHSGEARRASERAPISQESLEDRDDEETSGSMVSEIRESLHDGLSTGVETVKEALTAAHDAARGAQDKVETMVHDAQEAIVETGHAALETARRNPLPLALAGLGVACAGVGITLLVLHEREESRMRSQRARPQGGQAGGRGRGRGQRSGQSPNGPQQSRPATAQSSALQRTLGDLGSGAGRLAQRAQSSLGDATRGAGQAMSKVVDEVKVQGRRAGTALENAYDSNPLAVGAAVVAAGTIVGLALPNTQREDRWLGEGRDQVMSKAKDLAKDAIDKVDRIIHPSNQS